MLSVLLPPLSSLPFRRHQHKRCRCPKWINGILGSLLEVLCFWASLFTNNFVQVTLASSHKMLALLQDGCQEVIMRLHLLTKLFRGIIRRTSNGLDLCSSACEWRSSVHERSVSTKPYRDEDVSDAIYTRRIALSMKWTVKNGICTVWNGGKPL